MINDQARNRTDEDVALLGYYDAEGIKTVRLNDAKKPVDQEWQIKRLPLEQLGDWVHQGGNVGWQCGEVSGWLSGADLDWPEARALRPKFLPDTLLGAKGQEAPSQAFYRSEGLGYAKFTGLDNSEIISIKASNTGAGHQIVVAPSVHQTKGSYHFVGGYNPAAIASVDKDELRHRVGMMAAASLVARVLPELGRHHLAMALAGYMLRNGEAEKTVLLVLVAAWEHRGAPREHVRDVGDIVRDTAEKIRNNEPATGGRTLEELVPGMPQKLAKFLGWQNIDTNDGIPKIEVNNRHLRDVTADALKALQIANDPPEVFVRAGALVRVREDEHGTPQIQPMELNHIRGRLARVADFVKVSKQGESFVETKVSPPEIVVKDLMALSSWPFPPLEAVVESPILRPNGSIFDTTGYDPETRLYYRPLPGFACPEIPAEPTQGQVRAALEKVNEAVGEFPYADKASAANALALIITSLIRQAIDGPTPLGLIDAPQAGTGKSLIAEVVAIVGTGRAGEMLGASRDDEEWRKAITAKLVGGSTLVIVDNVEGRLYAPSLARALTSRTWTDRVLGRSEVATVKQRATWAATGNNISLGGDLARRCYWIRLDAKQSRPWQREGFRHPDLTAWAREKRGELVAAVLTMARAWYAAGEPKAEGTPRLGSFEAWTETIGGILTFAGVGGFLGNLEELYDKADESSAEWEAFLQEWWRQLGEDPITGKALTKLINEEKALKDALPGDLSEALDKGEGSFTRRLGKALAKRAGTRYGDEGWHISEAGEERRAKLWRVQDSSGECEFVSFESLYNPSASKNFCNKNLQAGDKTAKSRSEGAETNSTNSQTHTDGVQDAADSFEWEGAY
jgi:hypothetical protein